MRRALSTTLFAIALGVGVSCPEIACADFLLGVNLVINGDAEAGATTGWSSTGVEIATRAQAGTLGLPPGTDIGDFAFTGGAGPATQTLSQTIDVNSGASLIDLGVVHYDFSILLQSRRDSFTTDLARATLTFLDGGGGAIGSLMFQDRAVIVDVHDWDLLTGQQVLPDGTRSVQLLLEASRSASDSSDGFFDNASLVLTAVPEPSSVLSLAMGVVGALVYRGRRRRPANIV